MHYYTFHIGDYAKDTGHLSLLEHGVYRTLLDWCYASEKALPADLDSIHRICRAFSKAERAAVQKVVAEFFPENLGRKNSRVFRELEGFKKNSTSAAYSAFCREWKRLKIEGNPPPFDVWRDDRPHYRTIIERSSNDHPTSTHSPVPIPHLPSSSGGGGETGWVPTDDEVFAFAAAFSGEPASGAPGPIPRDYVAERLKFWHGRREFPVRWQAALVAAWRADFLPYQRSGPGQVQKKAPLPAWREVEQLRGRIDQHPANPAGAGFVGFREISADQRAELTDLRTRLAVLEGTPGN